MVEEYPGNSIPTKPSPREERVDEPEARKVEKIVEGTVVRRKKSLGRRFTETFIGGSAKNVGAYILFEVLIPAAKDTIADIVTQGIERTLYGDNPRSSSRRGGGYRPSSGPAGHVNYTRYSSSSSSRTRERDEPRMSHRGRANHDFDEIVLDSRADAERVIDQLFELISKFEKATVADLYDMTGIDPEHTDYKWGWTDLRGARPVRVRNGYLVDLPQPEPIRN